MGNFKLTLKQTLILIVILLAGFILVQNVNNYFNSKLAAKYQEGIIAGKQEINNQILQNLQTNGFIKFNFNDAENKLQTLILRPAQN